METVLIVGPSSEEDETKTCLICLSESKEVPDDMKMVTFVRDPECRCRPLVCLSCQPSLVNCPICRLPRDPVRERQERIVTVLVTLKAVYELVLLCLIIDTLIEGEITTKMEVIYCFTYLGFFASCPRELLYSEIDPRKILIIKIFQYFSIAMMFRGTPVKLSLAIYSRALDSFISDLFH